MSPSHDPGALLARSYPLRGGPRVHLRLVRPRDREGIRDLFASTGRAADELELARLVAFDLPRRIVLVATALIDARERVVGVGAVEPVVGVGAVEPAGHEAAGHEPAGHQPSGRQPAGPMLVVVDEALADDLRPLLTDALLAHARTLVRARAA